MRILAPAKINLHLRVGPRREHGFHPLASWMCTVRLFDILSFDLATTHTTDTKWPHATLWCDQPDIPTGPDNLVVRAASALDAIRPPQASNSSSERLPVRIMLQKRIPAGAGLGGGSSDAARTLLALNQLWQLGASIQTLAGLAGTLGSDVPFFLYQPSAWCTGRGETVKPIAAPTRATFALLLLPAIHMSTPAVYKRFDDMGLGTMDDLDAPYPAQAWADLPAKTLLTHLANDLEAPAFALNPALGELKSEVQRIAARPVRMSGSGSSLFTLFDDLDEANHVAAQIRQTISTDQVNIIVAPLAPELDDDLHGT